MTGYFGSGAGIFSPQKPGPLNLGGGAVGAAGTGLFAQKSPGVGTTGLGGLGQQGTYAGLGGTPARQGTGFGFGGTTGLGGVGSMGGTTGLSGMGGTTGLGMGMGATAGIGTAGLGGLGGMAGMGTGLGGTAGMGTLGGTGGLGTSLGGTAGMGTPGLGGLVATGFGAMGGTTGLVGQPGLGTLGGVTSALGAGFGLGGTNFGGLGAGLGGTSGLGTAGLGGVGGTAGLGGTAYGSGLGGGYSGMGRGTSMGVSGLGGQTGLGLNMGTMGASGGLGRGLGASTGYSGLGGGATGGLFAPKGQTNSLFNPATGKAQSHNDQLQLTAMALSSPTIFGDERDTVVTKLNQLQVYWGSGKGICNHTGTTVEFTETNPFFVMKSVGYIKLPTTEDKEGLVRIVVNKTEAEVKQLKSNICNTLRQIINNANVTPVIDSTYGIIETNLSEIRFYLLDGNKNRVSTRQVVAFFSTNDMTIKLRNMGVQELHPCLRPSDASIKAYLAKTPEGFDPNVWSQAVKNNPKPGEMIPVPILGFQALKARALAQKGQSEQHESRLTLIGKEITNLQQTQTSIVSKYEQAKRKQLELNHRLLKIMVHQETSRKSGHSIQEDEEQLRINFEMILNELTSPTGVKSELTEMLSMMRLSLPTTQFKENNYKLGEDVTLGIQMHLTDQQERIENLMKIIMEDMEDLNIIQEALVDGRM